MAKINTHQMIFNEIRMQIEMGVYIPGEKLPAELVLAEQFGVSRMTLRQALGRLSDERLLKRYPGVGTFVAVPPQKVFNRKIGRLGSFSDEIGYSGAQVTSIVKMQKIILAKGEVQKNLQLRMNQQVFHVVRIRIVQGTKAALQENWLPFNLVPELLHVPLEDESLYQLMKSECGIELKWAEQEVSAAKADAHTAKLLGIPIESEVLHISRTTFDRDDRPVEFAKSWTCSNFPLTMRLDK
jgi:GntR family transcriptional regulator